MSVTTWKPEYELGIKTIDDDHKILLQQMNELETAMLVGQGKKALPEIFHNLIEYTHIHFAKEEKIMQDCKYRDLRSIEKNTMRSSKNSADSSSNFARETLQHLWTCSICCGIGWSITCSSQTKTCCVLSETSLVRNVYKTPSEFSSIQDSFEPVA